MAYHGVSLLQIHYTSTRATKAKTKAYDGVSFVLIGHTSTNATKAKTTNYHGAALKQCLEILRSSHDEAAQDGID